MCVAALAGVAAMVLPGAARADPQLTGSTPADGAVVSAAPREVLLAFGAVPRPGDAHVSVTDARGEVVSVGRPRVTGNTVRQAIAGAATGAAAVTYHVTFDAGGQASGVVRFGIGAGGGLDRPADAAVHAHGIDPLSAVLLVVDGVALVVVVLLLVLRRPRRDAPTAPN